MYGVCGGVGEVGLRDSLQNLVVDPCRECVEVWERSGLRDSLQSVQWGGAELLSQVCFGIVRMFWSTCC